MQLLTGASTPWGNDAFPLCFRFPPISENILGLREKFSQFDLFPKKFSIFIRQIFWLPFCHWPKIFQFLPYFRYFNTFPLFREVFHSSPTFTNFPPDFVKFTCFVHTFCLFRFPTTLTMMHLCITQCTYWTPLTFEKYHPIFLPAKISKCLVSAHWYERNGFDHRGSVLRSQRSSSILYAL